MFSTIDTVEVLWLVVVLGGAASEWYLWREIAATEAARRVSGRNGAMQMACLAHRQQSQLRWLFWALGLVLVLTHWTWGPTPVTQPASWQGGVAALCFLGLLGVPCVGGWLQLRDRHRIRHAARDA